MFAMFSCVLIKGHDIRVRVSYQQEELKLKLPFGSRSRLFLSELNRAWSGKSYKSNKHKVQFSQTEEWLTLSIDQGNTK